MLKLPRIISAAIAFLVLSISFISCDNTGEILPI